MKEQLCQIRPAAVAATLAALLACLSPDAGADEPAPPTPQQARFFEEQVRPLLAASCFDCHGEDEQEADLRLDSLAHMRLGGESGPAIDLENPENSLLLEAINYESVEMPPDGQLDDDQIEILTKWVQMGAPWPGSDPSAELPQRKGSQITDEDRAWWAFQPVKDPAVPCRRRGAVVDELREGALRQG